MQSFKLMLTCIVVLLATHSLRPTSGRESGAPLIPTPSPAQYAWHEQERTMFVCLDPCTWQGREYDNHSTPLSEMRLPKLSTDQWCETARSWGAREILFVAKHTGGFCWWRTDTTDYCVRNIAWKGGEGDLLVDLARSCRKYGLNLGIYIYPGDESWGAGIGSGGKTRDPDKQEAYNEVFRRQWQEALETASRYTHVSEVWFDGSCVIEVGDIIKRHAPHAVVFQGPYASIRWVGNERGRLDGGHAWSTLTKGDLKTGVATAHHSNAAGDAWAPLEVNTTLYDHHWFWAAPNEAKRKSLDELMYVYYQSAGQGAVMLLNSTPNTDGLIPADDVRLYRALGAQIARRFERPIARARGGGSTVELDLGKPTMINHAVVMEDYWFGERIRAFAVEGWTDGAWKPLAAGGHVGRKRIVWFDDAIVSKLRLRVTESAARPLICEFAAFHVTSFRPAPKEPLRSPWRQCGAWSSADVKDGRATLTVDLTPFIDEAGQWQVQFRSIAGGERVTVEDEVLLQASQASAPGAIQRAENMDNTFDISRMAVVTEEADIRLRVNLTGRGSEGVILIRRR
ncbi:MAG: alpha-L-fucosidase [Sedimentisphaerales bacterium]|nr:alpha-L-fucosidase [Sedimentisphaerales bacterium]